MDWEKSNHCNYMTGKEALDTLRHIREENTCKKGICSSDSEACLSGGSNKHLKVTQWFTITRWLVDPLDISFVIQ